MYAHIVHRKHIYAYIYDMFSFGRGSRCTSLTHTHVYYGYQISDEKSTLLIEMASLFIAPVFPACMCLACVHVRL